MTNMAGPASVRLSRTVGAHGNQITILEAALTDDKEIKELIGRLSLEDLRTLVDTLHKRLDDGCNLFFRLDKQEAFLGKAVLTPGEDVILVRVRIAAFPAKPEIAEKASKEFLESELMRRSQLA